MKQLILLLAISLAIVGCSNGDGSRGDVRKMPLAATILAQDKAGTLAYRHDIALTAPDARVADVFRSVQGQCAELATSGCELLDSRLTTDKRPFATLKLRAPRESIEKIVDALPNFGEVTSRGTSVEDLAVAIGDSKKQLAIKTDYRTRLEALLPKASNDIGSLVKINQELAQVQGEIEAARGQDAYLAKRVATELLNVSIASPESHNAWTSLATTPDDLLRNLASGTSAAIATAAFLVPWFVMLTIVVFLFRTWRRLRRKRVPS